MKEVSTLYYSFRLLSSASNPGGGKWAGTVHRAVTPLRVAHAMMHYARYIHDARMARYIPERTRPPDAQTTRERKKEKKKRVFRWYLDVGRVLWTC